MEFLKGILANGFPSSKKSYQVEPVNVAMAKIKAIRWDYDTHNVAVDFENCGDQVMQQGMS